MDVLETHIVRSGKFHRLLFHCQSPCTDWKAQLFRWILERGSTLREVGGKARAAYASLLLIQALDLICKKQLMGITHWYLKV